MITNGGQDGYQEVCVDVMLQLLSMLPACVVICFTLTQTEDAAVNWISQ